MSVSRCSHLVVTLERNEEVTTMGIKIIVETCDSEADDEPSKERTTDEVIN